MNIKRQISINKILFVLIILTSFSCKKDNSIQNNPILKYYKVADNISRMGSAYIDCNKIVVVNNCYYFVYLSDLNEIMIRGFNPITNILTSPHMIGIATDNHGSPCIATDTQGYIYVMFGGHSNEIKFVRSQNPHDITAWRQESSIIQKGRTLTYPIMNIHKDKIFVLLRTSPYGGDFGNLLTFFVKDINEKEWIHQDIFKGNHDKWRENGDFKIWVNGYNRFYANLIVANNDIHITFQCQEYLPQSSVDSLVISSYFLGHIYSDDSATTWKTSSGKILNELPATPETINLIAGKQNLHPYPSPYPDLQAINVVAHNNEIIFCYVMKYKSYSDLYVAKLIDGKWVSNKIALQSKNGKIGEAECSFSIDDDGKRMFLIPWVDDVDFGNRIYGGNSTLLHYFVLNSKNEIEQDILFSNLKPSWQPNFGKAEKTRRSFLFTSGHTDLQGGNCSLYLGIMD